MDAITCNSCNRSVVPRLWHYQLWTDRLLANRFFNVEYMKTQHICRLCGVTMFETGGGLTLPGKIVAGFVLYCVVSVALITIGEYFSPPKAAPAVSCQAPACKLAPVKKN